MQNDNIDNSKDSNSLLKTCPICNKYKVAYNAKICPGCGGNIAEYYNSDNEGCIGCLCIIVWLFLSALIAQVFNWDSLWVPFLSAGVIGIVWFLIKKNKR